VTRRGLPQQPLMGQSPFGDSPSPSAAGTILRTMIHPRIDTLLENVDSRYALVIVAAKRARQINNYHHQLGEGTFDQFLPPLIESRSKNYLTMALEETAEGKIKYAYPK
jgi:DNA-directed RNA polymerase subunit omega